MGAINRSETAEERFKRVAETRTNSILDKLRLLSNCANNRIYSYTQSDVDKIFLIINKQLRVVRAKFNSNKERFKF